MIGCISGHLEAFLEMHRLFFTIYFYINICIFYINICTFYVFHLYYEHTPFSSFVLVKEMGKKLLNAPDLPSVRTRVTI